MSEPFLNLSEEAQSEKLLDYAKGRISEEGRSEIDAACQADSAVADELAYYQALNAAAQKPSLDATSKAAGWERLSQSIQEENSKIELPEAANDNTRFWRSAAAALAILLFGSATFNTGVWDQTGDDAKYIPVANVSSDLLLKVSFYPSATEENIRSLLLSVDGDIIQGPSALGLYDIQFKNTEARDKAIAVLEGADQIIETLAAN